MTDHYIRVQAISTNQMSTDVWLECSCSWVSSSVDGSIDLDLAARLASNHRRTA